MQNTQNKSRKWFTVSGRSKQAKLRMHMSIEVTLVWGSLRLAPMRPRPAEPRLRGITTLCIFDKSTTLSSNHKQILVCVCVLSSRFDYYLHYLMTMLKLHVCRLPLHISHTHTHIHTHTHANAHTHTNTHMHTRTHTHTHTHTHTDTMYSTFKIKCTRL